MLAAFWSARRRFAPRRWAMVMLAPWLRRGLTRVLRTASEAALAMARELDRKLYVPEIGDGQGIRLSFPPARRLNAGPRATRVRAANAAG